MEPHKDDEKKMVDGCRQIVDCINQMSFNKELNDQQVRSLVKMREIARAVINGRDEKVTESDVDRALRTDIDNMVNDCKDILDKITRMSCKGLNNEQVHSLSRIKELASGVVGKQFEVPRTPCNDIGEKHTEARVDTPSPARQSHVTETNFGCDFGLEGVNELPVCTDPFGDDGSPVLVDVCEDPNVEQLLSTIDLQSAEPYTFAYDLLKQSAESKEREQKLMVQINEMENILKGTRSRKRDKMLMEQIRALKGTLKESSSSTGLGAVGATSSSMSPSNLNEPEVKLGDNEVEARPLKIRIRRALEITDQPPMKTRFRVRRRSM